MVSNDKPLGYVISVCSSKGGVGKTTLTNLAGTTLAETGYRTTILDADPNYPQVGWAKLSARQNRQTKALEVVKVGDDASIIKLIKEAKEQSDVVLVDLEGRGSLAASDAMSRSDLVIIPAQPSMLDSREAAKALKLIEETEERFNRKIPHVVVFTKTDVCLRPDNYWELRKQFDARNKPVLNVEVRDREQFREIFLYGGSLKALQDNAKRDLASVQDLLTTIDGVIKERVSVPVSDRDKDLQERISRLFRNKKRLRNRADRFKRKIVGFEKAMGNANELVAAIVKYIQGDEATTTYPKGIQQDAIDMTELGAHNLEFVEIEE